MTQRLFWLHLAGLKRSVQRLEFPASGNGTEPSSSIETLLLHLKVDSFEKMCSCNGCALCHSIVFIIHSRQLKDVVFKLEARGMNAAELHGALSKLDCDLVANLDLPPDSIHHAHHVGRTGRLGRRALW
ncbi:DEAD-BOX ATP-DEPENDENT RNA HELICASE 47 MITOCHONDRIAL [Salix koriyanagi]|uniref:RNA helicase n=1 Tax=Salix koriyanagi TaxID=2511006 RepID=A0A9Q0Q8E8_9ROSI|nr:DEAD-BOX ATP-DEPENDENT RNA HELICASE 47 MITOCHONDRIAL [Salix koriyanagi]